MVFVKLCAKSELNQQKMRKYLVQGESLLAVLDASGTPRVFRNLCSHAEKPLESGRWDPARCTVLCPFHKSDFDVCKGGKALTPPAISPIDVFPTEVKESQEVPTVFVDLD